jgi:hypothetical protein
MARDETLRFGNFRNLGVRKNVFAKRSRHRREIRGHPEEDPLRKAKLLSTVAFALLFGAGAASAQGMSKDTPERAPAAQQNAPAEKVAPSMKNGEHKAPQTTGQASPDAQPGKSKETTGQDTPDKLNKSDKAKETTGQSPKSEKSDMGQRGPGSAPQDASPAKGGVNNKSQTESNPSAAPSNRSSSEQDRATTGQGAGGPTKLSTEQRTKISSVIRSQKVERVNNLNVSISVGTRIPASVHVYALPQEVIVIYPEWRGYDYILVGEQIVIISPRTHEIVAVLEA